MHREMGERLRDGRRQVRTTSTMDGRQQEHRKRQMGGRYAVAAHKDLGPKSERGGRLEAQPRLKLGKNEP